MPRPIILGVVGDSAAGKTTITRGLVRILGEDQVTHVGLDDYHRYDRNQRAANGITPLRPDANYMDIMTQHLRHLRGGVAERVQGLRDDDRVSSNDHRDGKGPAVLANDVTAHCRDTSTSSSSETIWASPNPRTARS